MPRILFQVVTICFLVTALDCFIATKKDFIKLCEKAVKYQSKGYSDYQVTAKLTDYLSDKKEIGVKPADVKVIRHFIVMVLDSNRFLESRQYSQIKRKATLLFGHVDTDDEKSETFCTELDYIPVVDTSNGHSVEAFLDFMAKQFDQLKKAILRKVNHEQSIPNE